MSRSLKALLIAGVTGFGITLAHAADDDSTLASESKRTDQIAAPSGAQSVVIDRIASDFGSTFGTTSMTSNLITGLRNGTSFTLGGVTLTPTGKMGFGEVFIVLALTKASASGATAPQLAAAMNAVLADRASGMGWGQIAKSLDLNLGLVIAQLRSGNDRLAMAVQRAENNGTGTTRRLDRPEKPQRPERPDRPERPGKG